MSRLGTGLHEWTIGALAEAIVVGGKTEAGSPSIAQNERLRNDLREGSDVM
jgi:hypothetical protein